MMMYFAMYDSDYDGTFVGTGVTIEEAYDNLLLNLDGSNMDDADRLVSFYAGEPVNVRRVVRFELED